MLNFKSPLETLLVCLAILVATYTESAVACIGGSASFGNAVLRAGHVTVNDVEVPFPVVNASNANKVLDPIPLVQRKDLKVFVVYIETTAKYEVASVVYKIEQDGYPPTTVRVKSNVTASGMRTRSIAPPVEIPREPIPSVDDVYGCGGSEGGSGSRDRATGR